MNPVTADQFPALYVEGNVVQIKKLSHRHLAIMDWMLANPREKLSVCAKHMGVTQAWLSTVINSDLFKARFAERRGAMEEHQRMRITQRLADMAEDSLGAMHDAVQDPEVDPSFKKDAARLSLEALGILGAKGGGVNVQVNNQVADPHAADAQALREARERMSQARVVKDV